MKTKIKETKTETQIPETQLPVLRRKVRRGKIGKLPRHLRNEVCQRLDAGQEGSEILAWLNELPETKEMLEKRFDGNPITPQNLSEWRQGGFRDWLGRADARDEMYWINEYAGELEDEGEGNLGDQLCRIQAVLLSSEMRVALAETESPKERLQIAREVMREMRWLRKGDHDAARKAIHEQRWEHQRIEMEDRLAKAGLLQADSSASRVNGELAAALHAVRAGTKAWAELFAWQKQDTVVYRDIDAGRTKFVFRPEMNPLEDPKSPWYVVQQHYEEHREALEAVADAYYDQTDAEEQKESEGGINTNIQTPNTKEAPTSKPQPSTLGPQPSGNIQPPTSNIQNPVNANASTANIQHSTLNAQQSMKPKRSVKVVKETPEEKAELKRQLRLEREAEMAASKKEAKMGQSHLIQPVPTQSKLKKYDAESLDQIPDDHAIESCEQAMAALCQAATAAGLKPPHPMSRDFALLKAYLLQCEVDWCDYNTGEPEFIKPPQEDPRLDSASPWYPIHQKQVEQKHK